jgi:defect-in-organelle-trafficking protein DotC
MMNARTRTLRSAMLCGVAALILGGCQTALSPPPTVAAVNPDYRAGLILTEDQPIPTLAQVINQAPSRAAEAKEGEDRLRGGAMRDAALSYGARSGLAWESRAINKMLQDKSDQVAKTYDFNRAMIKGPNQSMILPPVISQANESWETSEAGRSLRVADTVFEIVEQARFAPVAPQWQTYLVRDYKTPEPPPDSLLPRDGVERDQWKRWVTEGWAQGQRQAQDIFKADLSRLERDFTGMTRYKALLEQGKVSAPVVADAKLGTTGSGQDMRVNDRAIRITQDPKLNVQGQGEWRAPATTAGPDGVPTGAGPDGVPTGAGPAVPPPPVPAAAAPAPRKAERHAVRRAEPASLPAPSRRPVRGGGGERAWDAAPTPPPEPVPESF